MDTEDHPQSSTTVKPMDTEDHTKSLAERVERLEKVMGVGGQLDLQKLQDMISSLESKVEAKQGGEEEKERSKIMEDTLPKTVIPEVRRVVWSDFKNRYNEVDGTYAIEVLYVGSDLREEVQREHQARRRSGSTHKPKVTPKHLTEHELSRRWIYRIRIQSRTVLNYLAEHLTQSWDDEIRTFIRPFRPLIALQEKMRASLSVLEQKWASHEGMEVDHTNHVPSGDVSGSTPITPTTPMNNSGPDDIGKTFAIDEGLAALRELRCYVQFMENEVMTIRSRLAASPTGGSIKVRWDDLWCLFRRTQYVYTPVDPNSEASNIPQQGKPRTLGWQTVRKLLFTQAPSTRLKTPGRYTKKPKKKADQDQDSDDEDDGIYDSNEWFVCETDPAPPKDQQYCMSLWCYHIDYDGHTFRPVFSSIDIEYFHGEREIDSLVAYPLSWVRESEPILSRLQLRGEEFKTYVQAARCYYNGRSLDERDTRHHDGEVIIDFEEALMHELLWTPVWLICEDARPEFPFTLDDFPIRQWTDRGGKASLCEVSEILQKDYGIESLDYNNSLKEDEFLVAFRAWNKPGLDKKPIASELVDPVLLPQRLFGYILRERAFCKLDIHCLRPLKSHSDAFDDLKINANNKRLVKSLIQSHFLRKESQSSEGDRYPGQDIIQGKANNLIILLHGVPGVGKTATAEAVADVNDKPLFPITCGDLGVSAANVESNLSGIFRLANKWNCVLLLDEADIFLATRRTEDLERNALVSVFLRILEYYSGILILTTNRVGVIDEAFQSRIHIMLYYPRLGKTQTMDIFKMNLKRLEATEKARSAATGRLPIEIDKDGILDFAIEEYETSKDSERWNGRQIRNAFQLASSIALSDWVRREDPKHASKTPPTLGPHTFHQVSAAIKDFHLYMRHTRGKDNWELAQEHNERADDFPYREVEDMPPSDHRVRSWYQKPSSGDGYHRYTSYNAPRNRPTGSQRFGYSDKHESDYGRDRKYGHSGYDSPDGSSRGQRREDRDPHSSRADFRPSDRRRREPASGEEDNFR